MTPALPRIAVLGARRSGKTWLAHALRRALGPDAVVADGVTWLTEFESDPEAHAALVATLSAHVQHHDLTLLTGLDLSIDDPAMATAQDHEDARLRAALAQAGIGYQVIYGQDAQRLENALLALNRLTSTARSAAQFGLQGGRMPWQCGNCSDPDCEHRLFTGLLAGRTAL